MPAESVKADGDNFEPVKIPGNEAVGIDVIQSFLDGIGATTFEAGLGQTFRGRTHTFHEIVEFRAGDSRLSVIRTARFKDSDAQEADFDTSDIDELLFDSAERSVSRKDYPGTRGITVLALYGHSRLAHFASGETVYVVAETTNQPSSLSSEFDPDAMTPTPPVSAHS